MYIKDSSCLVIGDLHLGKELKFENEGITFLNVTKTISKTLIDVFKKKKIKKLIILGDIKESIMYPDKKEYELLKEFFNPIEKQGIEILIAKGNHDGHLEEVFKQIKINATINKEIFFEDFIFMHGNSMPSQKAVLKKYIIIAHSHSIYKGNRIWIKAKIGKNAKKIYKEVNPRIQLIVVPHFNPLLSGLELEKINEFIPMFRNNVFDFKNKKIFTLNGKEV
ncbi:MAG: metallophosphoesterase [Candidatus Micrarchaeaceae archaeon]